MKHATIKNVLIILISIVVAYIFVKTDWVADFLTTTQEIRFFGAFFAGLFFTSIFTVVPATVIIAELASRNFLWELVVVGGIGAMIGDVVLFWLIRDQITARVIRFFGKIEIKKMAMRDFLKFKSVRWLAFLFGAIIIASPLPDEIGLSLMGIAKINIGYLLLLSFGLNALGILTVGGIAISLN